MRRCYRYLFTVFLLLLWFGVILVTSCERKAHVRASAEQCREMGRPARIYPEYYDVTIPPNIAPLNFVVRETGSYYYVKIYSEHEQAIEIGSRSPKIVIPHKAWYRLLNMNRGQQLRFDVFVKAREDQWQQFSTIVNEIADENVDGYVAYRKIEPAHSIWKTMGIYQRDLYDFDESCIVDNGQFRDGCVNCHSFCNNRTDRMLIGIRSPLYGSSALLAEDDAVKKIGTKFGYTSWHPSGRLAAYSINNIRLFFHSARSEVRGVVDLDSLLAYYLVESRTAKTAAKISDKNRLETYPAWSADGRWLYFCSAPIPWSDRHQVPPENYDQVKYDLVRVGYDLDSDSWGELETVLSAKQTDQSILLPRISPDGRWLLFCMCDYGSFPVYHRSSDLYMIDLESAEQTGRYEYRKLEINSDESESWHSWSSNSRWIAFSSKRRSGVFTRIYLSYVDREGKVAKPLLLPQKDPTYYDSCLWTYSVPELVTEPVRVEGERLARVVRGSQEIRVDLPITMATPSVAPSTEPWQQRE